MLHVVIADDENRICRLIRMLGHWEQFGMQVDGMASNGPEAIDLLAKNHTDILITDIRMPGISGLELIAQARGLNPELRFIVISGYADFSYAQEAISLGVSGYLLKPVNEQELNDTLEKIASEIGTKNEREQALRTAVQENEENLDKVKAALALDLIHGIERDYSAAALQKQNRIVAEKGRFLVFCIKGRFLVFCIKADEKACSNPDRIRRGAFDTAQRLVKTELAPFVYDLAVASSGSILCGVILEKNGEERRVDSALRRSIVSLQTQNDVFGKWNFTMGEGERCEIPQDLPASFRHAQMAAGDRILHGCGRLYQMEADSAGLDDQPLLVRFWEQAVRAVEQKDLAGMDAAVRNLRRGCAECMNARGWEYFQVAKTVIGRSSQELQLPVMNELTDRALEALENSSTVDEVFTAASRYYQKLIGVISQGERELDERPIRLARRYIMEHYAEPLTLEEVSEIAGLVPNYFSSQFKKVTGDGFAHYLIGVRMDAAKRYLQQTSLPVSEIAGRVGYNDVKYFTKTFIKLNGIKPTVYRKLYG